VSRFRNYLPSYGVIPPMGETEPFFEKERWAFNRPTPPERKWVNPPRAHGGMPHTRPSHTAPQFTNSPSSLGHGVDITQLMPRISYNTSPAFFNNDCTNC